MTTTDPYPFGGFGAPPQAAPAFDTSPPTANEPTAQPAPPPQVAPQPPAGPPVFGRRDPAAAPIRRVQFQLATYDQRGTETLHPLTALADVDMASVFGLGRAGGDMRYQLGTIRNLLMRVIVDDDGIGLREKAEPVVPRPDGQDSDDLVPVEELTPRDEDGDTPDGWTAPWLPSDVALRTPDGELHDDPDDAADHMREHGSSLRRFVAIMDDDSLIIQQEALEGIIDYVMSAAADRPTKRSSGPSRSRRRKGR